MMSNINVITLVGLEIWQIEIIVLMLKAIIIAAKSDLRILLVFNLKVVNLVAKIYT